MSFVRRFVVSLSWIVTVALFATPALSQSFTTVGVGTNPFDIAVNSVTNKIYVANRNGGNVTVINGADDTTSTIPADTSPWAIAVNQATNKIYVANQGAGDLTAISGLSGHTVPISVGPQPVAVAVNPVTNRIYVCNRGNSTLTVVDGGLQQAIATVPVGANPIAVAVNSVTNKIYVASFNANNITVIDGATLTKATIGAGTNPNAIAVNPVTNKIYVTNSGGQNVTIIDGASTTTTTVTTGNNPFAVAVNSVTNQVFVLNRGSHSVAVVDGLTGTIITTVQISRQMPNGGAIAVNAVTNKVYAAFADGGGNSGIAIIDADDPNFGDVETFIGDDPVAIAVNPVTNRVYAANFSSNNVTVVSYSAQSALRFIPTTPCRLVDTRLTGGPITGGTSRNFFVPQEGGCNIPTTAAAYSLNVTAVPSRPLGFLTIWPTGEAQPLASTMNSLDGRIKADAAIVPAGYHGAASVFVTDTTNLVLDIDGYFVPATDPTSLAFYPLTPCRVADTRGITGPLGGPSLSADQPRAFPILSSNCQIPGTAKAYSLNFTVVPKTVLGFLSVWPSDQQQPRVSTLNDLTGTVVANAAIVPGAANGDISAFASNDTDLIIDVNGYFDDPGQGGLSLIPTATCRVIDTRKTIGAFSGAVVPFADVVNSVCALPPAAQAYVFNATAVPAGQLGFLTLWPDGESRPVVSTLNALDGAITNNMAIVPTTNGMIDAFASGVTNLILDISSYFQP